MSLIEKLFNKLSKSLGDALQDGETTTEKTDKVGENVTDVTAPTEVLEDKEHLVKSIISTLTKLVEDPDITAGKQLVIWLDCDQLTFSGYDTDAYRQQILSALVYERDFGFEQVAFSIGRPAKDLRATRIGGNNNEYLQMVDSNPVRQVVNTRSVISIFGNAGSLVQEKYELSCEDMQRRRITAYNIGAGQFPQVPSGYRENHIAIDDNPASPMAEKNKYVSRMHAHIGFSDKIGFYLQVERDGTRLMGKRTRIYRGEDKIECDNPLVKNPLQTGDLIELGKAVVLKYEQIN